MTAINLLRIRILQVDCHLIIPFGSRQMTSINLLRIRILQLDCPLIIPFGSRRMMNPSISLLKVITGTQSHNNFLQVNLYFAEMSNEIIREIPEWTGTKVLSDIGGQMGIWLGASVFSVIELLILGGWIPIGIFCKTRKTEDKDDNEDKDETMEKAV